MELTIPAVQMVAAKMTGAEFIPWRGNTSGEVSGCGVMTSLGVRHTSREKALPQTTITSEVEQICCGTRQQAFSCHFAVLPA